MIVRRVGFTIELGIHLDIIILSFDDGLTKYLYKKMLGHISSVFDGTNLIEIDCKCLVCTFEVDFLLNRFSCRSTFRH